MCLFAAAFSAACDDRRGFCGVSVLVLGRFVVRGRLVMVSPPLHKSEAWWKDAHSAFLWRCSSCDSDFAFA